jgi:hypothetical protein
MAIAETAASMPPRRILLPLTHPNVILAMNSLLSQFRTLLVHAMHDRYTFVSDDPRHPPELTDPDQSMRHADFDADQLRELD